MKVNRNLFWHTFGKFQGAGFCTRCHKKHWEHFRSLVDKYENGIHKRQSQMVRFCKRTPFEEFERSQGFNPVRIK